MIPDEAVEAAHEQLDAMGVSVSKKDVEAALEAAAPHLLREAWEAGKVAGWDAARGEPEETNPYE